jgi:hypothetical protein
MPLCPDMPLSKVLLDDRVVLADGLGAAPQDDVALGHEMDPVAEAPDDVEVVLDDDHGGARRCQLPDHDHDLLGQVIRQTGGRLIEQQEGGPQEQTADDVEQLLLAGREGEPGRVVEPEEVEVVPHLLLVPAEEGPLCEDPVELLVARLCHGEQERVPDREPVEVHDHLVGLHDAKVRHPVRGQG